MEDHSSFKREEDQHAIEFDYEDEEEVAEMTSARVSSWIGDGGATVQGVVVIEDAVRTKGAFDVCPIFCETWATDGKHQICCLPCGHMYGMSCIKEWLQREESPGKCPQCNTSCTLKDVRMLYPTPLCVGDQTPQKASSTKHFPFTEDGLNAFKEYVSKQKALTLQQLDKAKREEVRVIRQWADVTEQWERVSKEWVASGLLIDAARWDRASERKHVALGQQVYALEQRAVALGRREDASAKRIYAIYRRVDACTANMDFFKKRYEEHLHNTQH